MIESLHRWDNSSDYLGGLKKGVLLLTLSFLFFFSMSYAENLNAPGEKQIVAESADDQYNLGVAYANGKGVPKDEIKAFELLRKAAGRGHAKAQYELGGMYAYGKGTPRDYTKAVEWFQKAADQGDSDAECMLGRMYADGSGVQKNDGKAAFWYKKAADQNNPSAQFTLALSYRYGLMGYPKDEIRSYAWLDLAAKSGVEMFVEARNAVLQRLTPEQKAEAQKLSKEFSPKVQK